MVYSGLMNVVLDSFDIRAIVGDDDVRIAVPGEVLRAFPPGTLLQLAISSVRVPV